MTAKTNSPAAGGKRRNGPAQAAADRQVESAQTRADADSGAEAPRLRLPLKTMDDLKAELARLYREGKAGRREVADVSRLANVLGILGRLIEGGEHAARLEALEEALERKR